MIDFFAILPASIGLVLLYWLQRRTESNVFVLAALPLALVAVVVGMYPAASAMVMAFVGIAESGGGSQAKLATMSAAMTRTLVVGVSICLLALIVSGALQAWTAFQQPPSDLDPPSPPQARWKAWALPISSLAVVPVALLLYNTARIANVVGLIADPAGHHP